MKFEGIILAAGLSSRAGLFKMEFPFGEKMLIQRVIEGMITACSRVIVVGGHKVERIREITKDYSSVRVVFNKNYREGMFGSVQEGVGHIEADAFFLMPGDLPFVTPVVYGALKEALESSEPGYTVFIPTFKGRKGHPVLMRKQLAEEIREEPRDSMLRTVINRNKCLLVKVEEEGILQDIDTIGDYKKFCGSSPAARGTYL
ncbi:MAG: nucleotidyltransferase family protein [bacterium]|nr:nucleotidyltransferase family protein [bacterium]